MTTGPRLWAPKAATVEIVVDNTRTAATPADGGWWNTPALPHGTDYQFLVDGRPPVPDPRSRWQPNGVHNRRGGWRSMPRTSP